ncbi:MAG TPA: DEAD/DEAH box helicase [Flavobacteriia bacterium]|nr:DEAD/DEAH box helicase [Flavobacteriia bacterium]
MRFKDLSIHQTLLRAIEKSGYRQPTEIQEKIIPLILQGKDVIGIAQTGTGKTAAFALPILQRLLKKQNASKRKKQLRALVITPTRELAEQIYEAFKIYGEYTNIRATAVFGGTAIEPQIDRLKKGVDILIATPGRLLDLYKREQLQLDKIEILVLDEADLMLDMGFIDDVNKIVKITPDDKQIALFSATMPDKIIALTAAVLQNPEKVEISQKTPKKINQKLYYVSKRKKMELILHLLRNEIKGSILIFRRTKFGVNKLEESLQKNGYKVTSLHGDKSQKARQDALKSFKNKEVNILIATDVASRGIDIEQLDAVINYDQPNIPETYVHRIGRTGRAGQVGKAYSLCSPDEVAYIKRIQKLIEQPIQEVKDHPYIQRPKNKDIEKPQEPKKKKYKKGRKSAASKKKKKRWY